MYSPGFAQSSEYKSRKTEKNREDVFEQLQQIEMSIETDPENAIEKLNLIIPYTIGQTYDMESGYAYMLIGRCYKILEQPKLALNYMGLAREQFTKEKTKSSRLEKLQSFQKKISHKSRNISEEDLEKNQEEKPNRIPDIYFNDLGEIYTALNQYDSANVNFQIFKERIDNPYTSRSIDYAIADNYYAAEEFHKAIEAYKALLILEQADSNDVIIRECNTRIAACYISLGETEKGLEYYNLSVNSVDEWANDSIFNALNESKELVTSALTKNNELDEVIDIRNDFLDLNNGNSVEYIKLAQTYYETKEYSKAEQALDKYLLNISYQLLKEEDISIIKEMAFKLKSKNRITKALNYLITYEQLQDTLYQQSQKSQQLGTEGYNNILLSEKLNNEKNRSNFLMQESVLKEKALRSQRQLIYMLVIAIILGAISLIYLNRIVRQKRVANQQLALRSLRSQMNPHFIFNALNSVNSFISMNDDRSANNFLSGFSTLMRTIMENSEHNFITLGKELEIIRIYLNLEHFRFKDKFEYQLNIHADIDEETFVLPPMIIQPYIENAIWHGLRYKESFGLLKIDISNQPGILKIIVTDNGIGRAKSQQLKTKNQQKTRSIALKNINERIRIFEDLHKIKVTVKIEDLHLDKEETGTSVTIIIPQPKV